MQESSTTDTLVWLMKLSDGKRNTSYKIIKIDESSPIRIDLFSLGIMEGDFLTINHIAPMGSPIALKHDRGSFFALRKHEASFIEVEEQQKEPKKDKDKKEKSNE